MLKSSFTSEPIDQATVDYYVAKGRRERSKAWTTMFKSLFSSADAQQSTPSPAHGKLHKPA